MSPGVFTWPNFFSVLRVLLLPGVAYGLARDDGTGMAICVTLFVVAAISDFLDGYLARRLNQITRLGIALDPVADKIFAGTTVILLVVYRDLPVWLALVVVGRDLLILGAGAILLRGRPISLPSNVVGKYAFGVIAFLLGSYVIRFPFGITLTTVSTLVMIAWSIASYAGVYRKVRSGVDLAQVRESRSLIIALRAGSLILLAWYVVRLYTDLIQ